MRHKYERTEIAAGEPIQSKSRYDGDTYGCWMVQAEWILVAWKQPGSGHANAMFGVGLDTDTAPLKLPKLNSHRDRDHGSLFAKAVHSLVWVYA